MSDKESRQGGSGMEGMLSLSIIVAESNQIGASRIENAATAVITHHHSDHFWPAEDGG